MSESTSNLKLSKSSTQALISGLKDYINQEIIGQDILVERMLIGLLADGHILVEGAPGLAKTRAINVLSKGIHGDFHRVQFTPQMLLLLPQPFLYSRFHQEGQFLQHWRQKGWVWTWRGIIPTPEI